MLSPNTFYHIYNHANGKENLFRCDENYRFFLRKISQYVVPFADVYAYCLMPNHFHLLIKTKPLEVYMKLPKIKQYVIGNAKDDLKLVEYFISKQFSNLFSSYTQSFNKVYKRMGSLFVKNFKKVKIKNQKHFKNIVRYIHANPVHHGFVKNLEDWPWSSYQTILTNKKTNLCRDEVITWFGDVKNYLVYHQGIVNVRLARILE